VIKRSEVMGIIGFLYFILSDLEKITNPTSLFVPILFVVGSIYCAFSLYHWIVKKD